MKKKDPLKIYIEREIAQKVKKRTSKTKKDDTYTGTLGIWNPKCYIFLGMFQNVIIVADVECVFSPAQPKECALRNSFFCLCFVTETDLGNGCHTQELYTHLSCLN